MTTQKRRVIYLSDEEWADVKEHATNLGLTMSAYIRSSLIGGHITPFDSPFRDGRLAATDAVRRFNSRPFTPAPKTKGK